MEGEYVTRKKSCWNEEKEGKRFPALSEEKEKIDKMQLAGCLEILSITW